MVRSIIAAILSVWAVGAAFGQLVVGVDDVFDNDIYLIDVTNNTSTPLFNNLVVWGMTADDANRTLYSVHDQKLFSIDYDTLTPVLLGDITEGGQNRSMVGLAFNPLTGKLYGTRAIANEGVYEIDLGDLKATLVVDYDDADYDFGGFACDPDTGKFYGLNDDADAFGGRGLYEININTGAITFIVGYPSGETDIDGLAIGNGRAYFVTDENGSFYVWNLATASFEAPLTSPFDPLALTTYSGAAWAPGLMSAACVGDLDGSNGVDLTDLGILLGHYGESPADPADGDINDDDTIDLTDLGLLLGHYGETCP